MCEGNHMYNLVNCVGGMLINRGVWCSWRGVVFEDGFPFLWAPWCKILVRDLHSYFLPYPPRILVWAVPLQGSMAISCGDIFEVVCVRRGV